MRRVAKNLYQKGRLAGVIVLSIAWLCLAQVAEAAMPLPTVQSIPYSAVESPVLDDVAVDARPIGVGTPDTDHNLKLQIGLNSFAAEVDIYLAIYAPSVSPDVLFFDGTGGFVPITRGVSAWKTSITGPVNENLLGSLPLGALPSGDYAFVLLIVPAGATAEHLMDRCYLWTTRGNGYLMRKKPLNHWLGGHSERCINKNSGKHYGSKEHTRSI